MKLRQSWKLEAESKTLLAQADHLALRLSQIPDAALDDEDRQQMQDIVLTLCWVAIGVKTAPLLITKRDDENEMDTEILSFLQSATDTLQTISTIIDAGYSRLKGPIK